jgi:outer membrane receptor protein involved in Fe transport
VASDTSGEPAIRGSGPQDNAYYVDTLPVGYLFHAGGFVSVLHSDLISDFSLYSAAFGPRFTDVTGAIIDVRQRAPRTDRLHATVDFGISGFETIAEGPVGESQSFSLAGRRSFIDLFAKKSTDANSGVVVELPRYGDYQARYLWAINDSNRLALHVNGASDHVSFDIPKSSQYAQHDPVLAGSSAVDQAYGTQALVWDASLAHAITSQLALVHMLTRSNTVIGSAGSVRAGVGTTFLREELRIHAAPGHELLVGAQAGGTGVDVQFAGHNALCTQFDPGCDLSSAPLRQLDSHFRLAGQDLHAQDRWAFAPSLTLVAGARWSHEDYLHRSYAEPRLALEWEAGGGALLTAGWGRHNQFPNGEEVVPTLGNPHLLHLVADHSVLGWSQALGAGWSVKTEAYYKTFSDLVTSDPVVNYTNSASGRAWGLESLVKKDAGAKFSGWLSLSLSHSQRHNDLTGASFPFAVDQPVILSLVGEYKYSPAMKFGARYSYHTGSPYTPVIGTGTFPDGHIRPIYGAIDSQRFAAYQRLDLRMDRRISQRFTTYVEAINATAHRNVEDYLYSIDYSAHKDVTQLPFLVSAGLQYDF